MAKAGVFVGLSTVDVIYNLNEFPLENSKVVAQSQEVLVGGPATNAAVTFSFLGGKATLAAPVGRHPLASLVREDCRRYGVRLIDLFPDSDEIPSVSSAWVDRRGRRSLVSVNTTRTRIQSCEIHPTLLASASMLLVDGHAMKAALKWARAARLAGVKVVFDGGSWKPETEKLLRSVDIAICSADFRPPGCTTANKVIQYLRQTGISDVAMTHGADPVHFVSGRLKGSIDVPRMDAVDTVGAGDIFHGAFCFYFSEGNTFEGALGKAAKIAAESCRYRGTRRWMENQPERMRVFAVRDPKMP